MAGTLGKPLMWLPRPADSGSEHELALIYRVDPDAVIIADVFAKKTQAMPQPVVALCKRRLRQYDEAVEEQD
jgi:phage-related protein